MNFLSAIHIIAERRIEEALKEGRLNNLSYKNKALPDDNTQFIPEDMKMAYKMLKNSGYLPPEIETRKEIRASFSLPAPSKRNSVVPRESQQAQPARLESEHGCCKLAWVRSQIIHSELQHQRQIPALVSRRENSNE